MAVVFTLAMHHFVGALVYCQSCNPTKAEGDVLPFVLGHPITLWLQP